MVNRCTAATGAREVFGPERLLLDVMANPTEYPLDPIGSVVGEEVVRMNLELTAAFVTSRHLDPEMVEHISLSSIRQDGPVQREDTAR
jgi:hypothetical protein